MADDIVARLSRWIDPKCTCITCREVNEAINEIERLRALIDAIDALHQPSGMPYYEGLCSHCTALFPCPTHLLIHPMTLPEALEILKGTHK